MNSYLHACIACILSLGAFNVFAKPEDVKLLKVALGAANVDYEIAGLAYKKVSKQEIASDAVLKGLIDDDEIALLEEGLRTLKSGGAGGQMMLDQKQFDTLNATIKAEASAIQDAKSNKDMVDAFKKMYAKDGSAEKFLKETVGDAAAKTVTDAVGKLTVK